MLLAFQSLLWGPPPPVGLPVDPQWLLVAPPRRFRLIAPGRQLRLTARPRRLRLTAPARILQLKAVSMPFVGDLSAFDPVESVPMSIDFTAAIPTGDSIVSIGGVSIAAYLGADSNASALLTGAATLTENVATQMIGPGGVAGVTYRLTITIITAQMATFSAYAHVFCAPVN